MATHGNGGAAGLRLLASPAAHGSGWCPDGCVRHGRLLLLLLLLGVREG